MQQLFFSGTVAIDIEKRHHQPLMFSDAEQTDLQTGPCHLNSHTNPILTSGDYLHAGPGSTLVIHTFESVTWTEVVG